MLFNSYSFIFLFLPVALLGYALVGRFQSRRASLTWLVVCSIAFYGVWNPVNLAIMLPSIGINYVLASLIRNAVAGGNSGDRRASLLLTVGLVFNLCFLGYFKYKNFFLDTANLTFGSGFELTPIILPLAISFITFQKIAFLVDVRSGNVRDFDLYNFLTFVFFFPQLIAGPIVHYREMMPQFEKIHYHFRSSDVAVGLCLFSIGLFKKVVLADGIAGYASPVFAAAEQGQSLDFMTAWTGALAYTFQIYFDFSGYSDMAIGLARLFGIRLPLNFNSPLKATNIIDFWARWHVTLTRFLTAYVYTPVMLNLTRKRMAAGKPILGRGTPSLETYALLLVWPTMLTMFLSGFWHGAGFTFLLWGLLHGFYLCVNHAWRIWRPRWDKASYERYAASLGFLLTFTSVVFAMVLFRADSVGAAAQVFSGMLGFEGVSLPQPVLDHLPGLAQALAAIGIEGNLNSGGDFAGAVVWIVALGVIALLLPNSLQLMAKFEPAILFKAPKEESADGLWQRLRTPRVDFTAPWAMFIASAFVIAAFGLNRVTEFLYWQF